MNNKIWIGLVIGALLIGYGVGMFWGLPAEFSPAVDVPFPIGALGFVGQYKDPTSHAKYPAFHQVLTLGAYAGDLIILMLNGNFNPTQLSSKWPYGFQDPVQAFSLMLFTSRLISLAMGITILLFLARKMPLRAGGQSHLLAIALLALGGPFTYYAREANFDIPYNFWWTLAFIFTARYLFTTENAKPNRDLLWGGIFSALAVATKDQAGGLIAGLGLVIVFINPSHDAGGWKFRLKSTIRFGLAAAATYILAAIAPQPARWWYHISLLRSGAVTEAYLEFPPTLLGQIGLLGDALRDLSRVISPLGVLLALFGLVLLAAARQWKAMWFLFLPAFVYYILIIANVHYVYERFMLPVGLLWVAAVGFGLERVRQYLKTLHPFAWALAAAVLLGWQIVIGYLPTTYLQLQDTKRALSQDLGNYVAPGSAILWIEPDNTRFPNAVTYEAYHFTLPQGVTPLYPSSEDHIFSPYSTDVHCLLTVIPDDPMAANLNLIKAWTLPAWVRDNVMNQAPIEYYLYDLDGKCQNVK